MHQFEEKTHRWWDRHEHQEFESTNAIRFEDSVPPSFKTKGNSRQTRIDFRGNPAPRIHLPAKTRCVGRIEKIAAAPGIQWTTLRTIPGTPISRLAGGKTPFWRMALPGGAAGDICRPLKGP